MSTIRIPHRANYTQIRNETVRDARLSLRALGLLILLLSYPDDWVINVNHLMRSRKEGRDAIKNTIRELEEFGYLEREQTRDSESGKFSENAYVLHECPIAVDGKPVDGKPVDGKPVDGKPVDIINTKDPRKTKKQQKTHLTKASERENFSIDDESDRQTEKAAEPKTDRFPIRTVDPIPEDASDRPPVTSQHGSKNLPIEPEIIRETIYSAPATDEPAKREPKTDRFFGQSGNQLSREKRRAEQRVFGEVFLKYPRPAEAERDFYEKAIAYYRATSDPAKVHPGSIEAFATATLGRVNRGAMEPRDTLLIEQWERGELDRYEGAYYDPQETKRDHIQEKVSGIMAKYKQQYREMA